jgi:signal transduction histidine kinase
MVSLPLRGESVEGRLFVLDKTDATLDDLVLGEVVAGIVAARLDAYYLTEQLRQAAATEERIRLSRDLHDGVLQSFTGVALRLEAVRRMMSDDRPVVAAALTEAQRILASEQRDIRFFIAELKPGRAADEDAGLEERLADLALRMEREWDLRVELSIGSIDVARVPASLGHDVYHIVREALMNAARHGAASTARVAIVAAGAGALRITITDNGCGFAFSGRYSSEELARLEIGPKTLRERVRSMNGSLVLESASTGAELDVVLPVAAVA